MDALETIDNERRKHAKVRVSICLTDHLVKATSDLSGETGISRSALIRYLLNKFFEEENNMEVNEMSEDGKKKVYKVFVIEIQSELPEGLDSRIKDPMEGPWRDSYQMAKNLKPGKWHALQYETPTIAKRAQSNFSSPTMRKIAGKKFWTRLDLRDEHSPKLWVKVRDEF